MRQDEFDEEDRRFFEELSKGFSAKEKEIKQPQDERNEMMDDTKATRQMISAAKDGTKENLGSIDFNTAREEAKEDEYDYFLDNQPEENSANA